MAIALHPYRHGDGVQRKQRPGWELINRLYRMLRINMDIMSYDDIETSSGAHLCYPQQDEVEDHIKASFH